MMRCLTVAGLNTCSGLIDKYRHVLRVGPGLCKEENPADRAVLPARSRKVPKALSSQV